MSIRAEEVMPPEVGQTPETPLQVLVVDDSRMQRKLVAAQLKKWGFDIYEADSGLTALEVCKSQNIDMVLSDWVMPEMDGIEFCREFRKMERERYGYFILLTSKSEKGDVALGLDVGADDYLPKPVNSVELRARIQAGQRVLAMEKQLQVQNVRTQLALDELQSVYQEIQKDLKEAEKLQKSLIPESFSVVQNARISNLFQSSGHVGGDLVGHFPLTETRHAVYSLDVSGHGVSSALLTIRLAGYLSRHNKEQNVAFDKQSDGSFRPCDPKDIARKLNDRMLGELETELYFTLAFADIDLESGFVKFVQAGHPHPVAFGSSKGIKFIGEGGPPVGLIGGLDFETCSYQMAPGEKLLLYSDGLTECENDEHDLLDEDGLENILTNHSDHKGTELLNDVLWELTEYTKGQPFGDDLSMILFEFDAKRAS